MILTSWHLILFGEMTFVKTYSQHLMHDSKTLIPLVAIATCFILIGCPKKVYSRRRFVVSLDSLLGSNVFCFVYIIFKVDFEIFIMLFWDCFLRLSADTHSTKPKSKEMILPYFHYTALFLFLEPKTKMQQRPPEPLAD